MHRDGWSGSPGLDAGPEILKEMLSKNAVPSMTLPSAG